MQGRADMLHADVQSQQYRSWLSMQCLLGEQACKQQADVEARAGRAGSCTGNTSTASGTGISTTCSVSCTGGVFLFHH